MTALTKAVFLDRDGVVNELVYYPEHGIVDSPFTQGQFKLLAGVGEAIRKLRQMGYKVLLVSNQPGIAKRHFSPEEFQAIRAEMNKELAREGAWFDGEYYCFHHPEVGADALKVRCECRKPKPGLLLQAAKEMDINLSESWMIGDGLTDVKAGMEAGCRTILLGRMKCELCPLMEEENIRPFAILPDLKAAAQFIRDTDVDRRNLY